MSKTSWTAIRDALEQDINLGNLSAGDKLPTEPELAMSFGVGRHSVRRAVADLAKSGKVSVEQGRGTFVRAGPVLTYQIGKRTRLRDNLSSLGIDVVRELLEARVCPAPETVRSRLKLQPDAEVSESLYLTEADGQPIAFGTVYHSIDRFPGYIERRAVMGSVTAAYKSYGIEDYVRSETAIIARQASPEETKQLRQHPELPVMVVTSLDALPDGTPISLSEVVWSSARVRFVLGTQ